MILSNFNDADEPLPVSSSTDAELRAAINQAIRMACPEFGEKNWPSELLQACIARDGHYSVICRVSELAAHAVLVASDLSGESLNAVMDVFSTRMGSDGFPFSAVAWMRAQDVTLERLGVRRRLRGKGPIDPVDLAGALVLVHVLATIMVSGLQAQPEQTRRALFPSSKRPNVTRARDSWRARKKRR